MNSSDIFLKILLSILFGAILGLETQTRENEQEGEEKAERLEHRRIGGFRTYSLLSLLGGIAGIFFISHQELFSIVIFAGVIGFLLIAYAMNIRLREAFGLTTEIAVILTFLLGFLTTSSLVGIEIILVILVLMAFFLSQKRGFGLFIKKIQHKEITDVFRFGLISLVILPILPNHDFLLSDILTALNIHGIDLAQYKNISLINPFQIWSIVVIISGISLGGYIATRIIGEKLGLFVTSVISGLVSSTSALISFAAKSKAHDNANIYAGASVISTGFSFVFVGFLMLISNREFFNNALVPLIIMIITGVIVGIALILLKTGEEGKPFQIEYEAFSVGPAVKFVSVVIILRLLVQILQGVNASPVFILATAALSGVTGIDAPAIAIATLATGGIITINQAVFAFLATNLVNLVAKSIYSYSLGTKLFLKYAGTAFMIIALVGFAAWLL